MIHKIHNILLQKSHGIYVRHLKKTRAGRFLAQRIVDFGLVNRTDVQIAELSRPIPKASHPDLNSSRLSKYSKYSQEINSIELPNFHLSPPLNFKVSEKLNTVSYINVLLPSLQVKHMSGGPNTALLFAALLAERGEHIRLIACDVSTDSEEKKLYSHMDSLLRRPVLRERIELVDAFDRSKVTHIGIKDIFFATAWWTAQIAKYGAENTAYKSFIYLIQDFEPILHEGSTFYARALETYGLPHIPLVNTHFLLDHLIQEKAGYYANQEFASNALAFEPAIDRNYYFPEISGKSEPGKKVLLFYARPTMARRNLFEIGVVALRQAVASGVITDDQWEVWAMGEKLPPISLGNGVYINPLPWLSFEEYSKRVRTADLLLSLMLSPHPSYPPLEMAASGKIVVTNSFSVKTHSRLSNLSPNIIVADPTPQSVGTALEKAISRINVGLSSYDPSGTIELPKTWEESLDTVIPELLSQIKNLRSTPPGINEQSLFQGYPYNPKSSYEYYRKSRLEERRKSEIYSQEPGLLSFITSAYNTPANFLLELGSSIFLQDGGLNFEWLILDNGSTHEDTLKALSSLAHYPNVRLKRVENNLGIIGGMRYLLEHSQGRYVLPLDSDDLVEPDCVNVITHYIRANDFPEILYTDEDKIENSSFKDPYFKPSWDPVLFLHSCYIAHLCVIDREKALALELYSDKSAEGCHDWDSFIRFMNAGYTPCHVPEVLYSWRIHAASTSGNILSKTYITTSHQATLQRFLDFKQIHSIDLKHSPLFHHNVDWWFKHRQNTSVSCETVMLSPLISDCSEIFHKINELDCNLINLRWEGIVPDNEEWLWEAAALFEMFPDTVMVGGIIHDGKLILGSPSVFGFGKGFDCPDVGRSISDSGYFAWLFKPRSVSAISTGHCVVTRSFLMEALCDSNLNTAPVSILGPWLGALAGENNRRVIFTPFMSAKGSWIPEKNISDISNSFFLSRFWHLILEEKFYSPRLGLNLDSAYETVTEIERLNHFRKLQSEMLPYPQWLKWQVQDRIKKYPLEKLLVNISLVTTIYEKTDFSLLEALANSLAVQTVQEFEWVLVAHGPINLQDLDAFTRNFDARLNIRLITDSEPLGIMGSMNLALEHAQCDYIVPIDADDLITPDALQILLHYISKNNNPDFLYSDEDLLVDDRFSCPYLRSEFDPILNLESSYIWHLCAIKREVALKSSLYTDLRATWCHDWNTVFELVNDNSEAIHIPEILYHWRQHKGSTTNNTKNIASPSLKSVKHILNRQISQLHNPENYFVTDWPIDRGAQELYIARKSIKSSDFILADGHNENDLNNADPNSIIVFSHKNVFVDISTTYPEVVRLFELHKDLGAIGGLILNDEDVIVDGCYVANNQGFLESSWLGQSVNYAGPYALALKPQMVTATSSTLAFFRVSTLKQSGCWPPRFGSLTSAQSIEICQILVKNNWKICFSPLVRAHTSGALHSMPIYKLGTSTSLSKGQMFGRYGLTRTFAE